MDQSFIKINSQIWSIGNPSISYDSQITNFNKLYNLNIHEKLSCGKIAHDNKFNTDNNFLQIWLPLQPKSLSNLVSDYFKQERTTAFCDQCQLIRYSRKDIL